MNADASRSRSRPSVWPARTRASRPEASGAAHTTCRDGVHDRRGCAEAHRSCRRGAHLGLGRGGAVGAPVGARRRCRPRPARTRSASWRVSCAATRCRPRRARARPAPRSRGGRRARPGPRRPPSPARGAATRSCGRTSAPPSSATGPEEAHDERRWPGGRRGRAARRPARCGRRSGPRCGRRLHRLLLVVRDQDGGDVDLVVQAAQPRRSSARTLASSAPNGSSSSRTFGSTASARASAMRWRWPPESCDG